MPRMQGPGRGQPHRPRKNHTRRHYIHPRRRNSTPGQIQEHHDFLADHRHLREIWLLPENPAARPPPGGDERHPQRHRRAPAHQIGEQFHLKLFPLIRGADKIHRAPATGRRPLRSTEMERPVLFAHSVPRMPRRQTQPRGAALLRRRQEYRRAVGPRHRRPAPVERDGGGAPRTTAETYRPRNSQGDTLAAALPCRRRTRIPLAQPRLRHPLRRRKPAHTPGHTARLRTR